MCRRWFTLELKLSPSVGIHAASSGRGQESGSLNLSLHSLATTQTSDLQRGHGRETRNETLHAAAARDSTNICHHGMGAGTGGVNIRNNSQKKHIVDTLMKFIYHLQTYYADCPLVSCLGVSSVKSNVIIVFSNSDPFAR